IVRSRTWRRRSAWVRNCWVAGSSKNASAVRASPGDDTSPARNIPTFTRTVEPLAIYVTSGFSEYMCTLLLSYTHVRDHTHVYVCSNGVHKCSVMGANC